jgi:hypothetical protein
VEKGRCEKILIYNNVGQMILRWDKPALDNNNGFTLNLSGLEKGLYHIRCLGNGFDNVLKWIKN